MLPDAIVAASSETVQNEASASSATLGQEDFLRMLVAQLENQDPLNPQDATEFTAQLAQFSSLEQLLSMRQALDEVVESQNSLSSAFQGLASTDLIGREVIARADEFEVDAGGAAMVRPAFDLESAATRSTLVVFNERGSVAARVELGSRPEGFQHLPEDMLSEIGLSPGRYRFELAAFAGDRVLSTTPLVVGPVTGALPSAANPHVEVGGIFVPFTEITEIRGSAP